MRKTTLILATLAVSALAVTSGCKKKAHAATTSGAASAKPAAANAKASAGGSGIPACDAYMAAVQKFMKCDGVPAASKTATQTALKTTKQSLARLKGPNVPAASKQAVATSCTNATAALKKGAAAFHCNI